MSAEEQFDPDGRPQFSPENRTSLWQAIEALKESALDHQGRKHAGNAGRKTTWRDAAEVVRLGQGCYFLSIALSESRHAKTAGVISMDAGRATVRIIPTDADLMIARSASRILEPTRAMERTEP